MKNKMPLEKAERMAKYLVELLQPACHQVVVGGSIRRRRPEVGDIEIVAEPIEQLRMFEGIDLNAMIELDEVLMKLKSEQRLRYVKNGPRMKQFELLKVGVMVDLFLVRPPSQWGCQLALRTGPREFSHKLVTDQSQGGYKPDDLVQQDGALWRDGKVIYTRSEQEYFEVLGLAWIKPEERG